MLRIETLQRSVSRVPSDDGTFDSTTKLHESMELDGIEKNNFFSLLGVFVTAVNINFNIIL
jgi:hypothetical protein